MLNILSTKIEIYRNLKDYKFLPKLDSKKREEIVKKVEDALKNELTKNDEGYVSKDGKIKVELFKDEHICISSNIAGFDKSNFEKIREVETILKSKLNLSYNDEYGYLMSDITRIGNGLVISANIDLSSIRALNKIEQVKQNVRKLGYILETISSNVYSLKTICTLGYSMSEVMLDFEKMLTKLQDLELESLKFIDAKEHDENLDRTYRSLAILNNAYMLSFDELEKLVSNIIIGANLGIIKIEQTTIEKLYSLALRKSEFISKTEMINLAKDVKEILKGEKNV